MQELGPHREQLTSSKLGKESDKPLCCHPCLCESYAEYIIKIPGEWIRSWHQDCWEKHQQTEISRWYHRKKLDNEEEIKSLLMSV